MNSNVSRLDLRLTTAAVLAFASLIGTILILAFSSNPTGHELQWTVTGFAVGIALALGSVASTRSAR